ncbi:carboxypeptidase-like regulatory domain-containing protein [Paludisphaera mucosa]|uniref:Carboxypeptidase-like regulatory domain-containing protein n=1 Tax=Paludisphaera mucosa TaxID=3030827 RepID=A0ABT6FKF7_9BACT|nr:carboxypeptidase-like regulatory domain-containing protein [Paludisphaera mucosa]MDG3008062.1 carboxypeptidase-like regulatory domain-containing protein [Paludisphaera mucosa]
MRASLVFVAAAAAAWTAAASRADEPPLQAAAGGLRAVAVAVVDDASGEPIRSFRYQARYEAPGRDGPRDRDAWTAVESPAGTFEVQAPPACRLTLEIKSPDYITDDFGRHEFLIRSDEEPRRVVARLRRGMVVRGTVRDSRSLRPIAGAEVAAYRFRLMGAYKGDPVETDVDGRYELRGIDPEQSIEASHPDYEDDPAFPDDPKAGPNRDFLLKRIVKVAITVVDAAGRPIEGVTANLDRDNPSATDKDGKLLVARRPAELHALTFRKEGYIDRKLEFEEAERELARPEGPVVVMEPTIAFAGRVVEPDGRPVAAFAVAAGSDERSSSWDNVRRDVADPEGRFRLGLSKEGKTWVCIDAVGFAPWEGWADVRRGGGPIEVRLSPGVVVSGRVAAPEALMSRIRAQLVPRRHERSSDERLDEPPSDVLPPRELTPADDGAIRFEHVRPDRYRLVLEGRGVPRTVRVLDVSEAGLDAGALPIDAPAATGRIEGRVWRPQDHGGEPWPFAEGRVRPSGVRDFDEEESRTIAVRTDENGRFSVDRVPVGLVEVGIPYQMGCVIYEHTWSALVVEGRTTTVRVLKPEAGREFALAFAIGDGSQAQYESGTGLGAARKVDDVTVNSRALADAEGAAPEPRTPSFLVDLTPLEKLPLAFKRSGWNDLDDRRRIVLPDVAPGAYRLRLFEWLGSRGLDGGPVVDREVVVPPEGLGEVRIPLGAGCITGKIPAPEGGSGRFVEVSALAKGSRTPRRAQCDFDGNFCVRHLAPGDYSLFFQDPNSGFRRVDDVKVPAGVIDVGELTTTPGATIFGEIRFARPSRVPDEIVATDPSGVTVRRPFSRSSSFDRIEVVGLWPGRWTVSARSGEVVLASGEIDVEGTGAFPMTLTVGADPNP